MSAFTVPTVSSLTSSLVPSGSPTMIQTPPQFSTSMALFLASPTRRCTDNPTISMGSASSSTRQPDVETSSNECFCHMVVLTLFATDELLTMYYMQCSMMVEWHSSGRTSHNLLLMIAKSAHLTVRGCQEAA